MSDQIDKQKLLIEMVMRQTNYNYEQAEEELKKNNNNYIIVIREAMGIKKETNNTVTSINQGIYKEIRTLMDTRDTTARINKEMKEIGYL